MNILSIHDGHTSTACLLRDGKLLGMASEERFTNVKNQGGFPIITINWLLESNDLKTRDIDQICMPGYLQPLRDLKEIQGDNYNRHNWFRILSKHLPQQIRDSESLRDEYIKRFSTKRKNLSEHLPILLKLGIDKSKIIFVEHHLCHASTAYYLDNNFSPERKVLIFTLDGSGDGLSATVNVGFNNKIGRIASISSYNSLGKLYSRVTSFLGMKPLEHEYKLMGMAPYADEKLTNKSYEVFKKYIRLNKTGLYFENISGVWGNEMIRKFQKDLLMHRFDGICAGLQKITEELALQWILNWIDYTNINDICLAGGVFMNVKLNMLINEHKKVNSVFFMPSCGDESIALGAALHTYLEKNNSNGYNIEKFNNLYFGPTYTKQYISNLLKKNGKYCYNYFEDVNNEIVNLLFQKKIIGRLRGRMEFGARALGNRSILADPRDYSIVNKINKAIKMRDFWMPFAPSILDTYTNEYLISKKSFYAPFMVLGYETTELARKDIIAGLHQSDFSCRPQIVTKASNADYYDLLKKFSIKTGIGGLLNTSFNIHGYPIVNSPENALWTLDNSSLDVVQLENFIVYKNPDDANLK